MIELGVALQVVESAFDGGDGDVEILLRFLLTQARLRDGSLRIEDFKKGKTPLPITFEDRI